MLVFFLWGMAYLNRLKQAQICHEFFCGLSIWLVHFGAVDAPQPRFNPITAVDWFDMDSVAVRNMNDTSLPREGGESKKRGSNDDHNQERFFQHRNVPSFPSLG